MVDGQPGEVQLQPPTRPGRDLVPPTPPYPLHTTYLHTPRLGPLPPPYELQPTCEGGCPFSSETIAWILVPEQNSGTRARIINK